MNDRKLEDFSEAEFSELVSKLFGAEYETEAEDDRAIKEFCRLAGHPSGSDLLFYPDPSRPNTTEGVVNEIKAWRAANGKPGFKQPKLV